MSQRPRNPFEHHHDHGHDHDHDHDHDHGHVHEELDPAQQSLADALRVSFAVLKIAMVILLVVYVFSGIYTVGNNEVAVRLRFGRIIEDQTRNQTVVATPVETTDGAPAETQVPGRAGANQATGLRFALPYPIEQVIKVNTGPRYLNIDKEFVFKIPEGMAGKTLDEMVQQAANQPLNPEESGFLVTGDANIMHARFKVTYHVANAADFVRNVGEDKLAEQIALAATQQAIIQATATTTSDAMNQGVFPADFAKGVAQRTLDNLDSGLAIDRITMDDRIVPLAVRDAYNQVILAVNTTAETLERARQDRDRILGQVAGLGNRSLAALIARYEVASAAGDRATLDVLDQRLNWMFTNLRAPAWIEQKLAPEVETRAWELLQQSVNPREPAQANAAAAELEKLLADAGVPADRRGTQLISGQVAEQINQAVSFRQSELERVRTRATEFRKYFDQFRDEPGLRGVVMARLWQQAKQEILTGDVETFYVAPGQTRIDLNRDPDVKKERERAGLKAQDEARRAAQSNVSASGPGGPPPPPPPTPPPPPPAGGGGDQH